jgi:hypothetical protein
VTRKDFEAIAHIIRLQVDQSNDYDYPAIVRLARSMSHYLSTTNPRFDAGRFMRACGL